MNQLQTGDLLLFSEHPHECCMGMLDCCIKLCTGSKYSHAALVVVDPPWAPSCKGIFVWESTWHGTKDPQDGLIKFGVQLTPIEFYTQRYPGVVSIYVREGVGIDNLTLIDIQKKVYDHKYDTRPKDWCAALFKRTIPRQTDVFTCSAFVSYVLTMASVLDKETEWTTISAAELACSHRDGIIKWEQTYGAVSFIGTYSPTETHSGYIEI